jgi:hypothetical protein
MAQIVQEMYDDLEDIANKRREGYYASDEEYYAALEASRKYYFGKLEAIEQDYSDYE